MPDISIPRMDRGEQARAFLAAAESLTDLEPWDIIRKFFLSHATAERLFHEEQLKRGDITLSDLLPHQRRGLVDPENVDLHAIAAGPIMDSNQLYLPAGKISLDEARARDAAQLLPPPPTADEAA